MLGFADSSSRDMIIVNGAFLIFFLGEWLLRWRLGPYWLAVQMLSDKWMCIDASLILLAVFDRL